MNKSNNMKAESSRRKFIKQSVIASSVFIVPRHVLGGIGFTAPSDQLVLAAYSTARSFFIMQSGDLGLLIPHTAHVTYYDREIR